MRATCVLLSIACLNFSPAVRGDEPTARQLTPHVRVQTGAVNGALIEHNGSHAIVYGWSGELPEKTERLLLTHHRRDVLAHAAGPARSTDIKVAAPAAEEALIARPEEFWQQFWTGRFHDYDQQSTKILATGLPVDDWVKAESNVNWSGPAFQVLETPGFTRGAVSYLIDIDGQRLAFTGDLIYGDGQFLDLYSFQDAIPEAQVRGYHGYGGRLAALVGSLERLKASRPDLLIPVRGPIVPNPDAAIDRLISRVRKLYGNYLSTNALHWYFKEQRMRTCGERVLGDGSQVELMPYSLHQKTPEWIWEQGTSRLLIADDGHGFLLDCGSQRVIDGLHKLQEAGLLSRVDGIFVTHYHDDHTDLVAAAAKEFDCPVYAVEEYVDILERPGAYHMPAMTANAIPDIKSVRSGHKLRWKEYELTFRFFPGQTIYHGGLLVRRDDQPTPVFFIGDAFAPSGIDDYCVLNRNLLHEDQGYRKCLSMVRDLGSDYWLINEHIPYVFRFSSDELDYLESRYQERIDVLRKLAPWDDPNYAVDEQWAVMYPYGVQAAASDTVELEVRLTNHSPQPRTFKVTPRLPDGTPIASTTSSIRLAPHAHGSVVFQLTAPDTSGVHVITADIESDGMRFERWAEALVKVE